MDNYTIKKKVIEKAVKGGFKCPDTMQKISPSQLCYWLDSNEFHCLIFLQSFAKAYWGEEKYKGCCECNLEYPPRHYYRDEESLKTYQYHLQQMVLAEDKLKYLEKFL